MVAAPECPDSLGHIKETHHSGAEPDERPFQSPLNISVLACVPTPACRASRHNELPTT